jgi:Uri superfamily endonuclease
MKLPPLPAGKEWRLTWHDEFDGTKLDETKWNRLGVLELQRGFYVYVGTAFGPGGLASRIQHHRQVAARPHWHIDYLRAVCDLVEVWFTTDSAHREHSWAKTVARRAGACMPLSGFGSSDCECETHLFHFDSVPSASWSSSWSA